MLTARTDLAHACRQGTHSLLPLLRNTRACWLRFATATIGCATLLIAAPSTAALANAVTLQGSTTFNQRLLIPHQGAIEAAAGQKLTVIPNKSTTGLLALFEGRADLAMISTTLESEVALLRQTHPDLPFDRLKGFSVTRTRIAVAVHPQNQVRQIDVDRLRRVLSGQITNWKELGGADLPIRIVAVREGGGVQLSLEAALGTKLAAKDVIRVQIGSQVPKVVEQEPAALGLAQLGLVRKHNLPELAFGQVVEQQLNLVSLGEPTAAMKAVIEASRIVATAKLD
jgi:phosphate transport system substrate-binding protein